MGKERTREALLTAAREVFARRGYHDAKVDEIADLAKVGKGTFYLYFKDKRAVFSELVDDIFDRIHRSILKIDVEADIGDQVRHNIRAVLAVLMDDPALTRILLSYAEGLDPEFMKKLRSFYASIVTYLEEVMRNGQKLGLVAPGSPHYFALFTVGSFRELLLEGATSGKERPREELVDALCAYLQGGCLRIPAARGLRRPRK